MSKVFVHNPTRAKGELVEVLFLGVFPNGEESDVTDEQVQLYQALSGRQWPKDGTLNLDRRPKKIKEEDTPVASPEAASKPAAGTTTVKKEGSK
jgi:hypothetical protein